MGDGARARCATVRLARATPLCALPPLGAALSRTSSVALHMPVAQVLDWRRYSVRIPRDQMPRLFAILRELSSERVAQMQAALREVWTRFSYIDTFAAERARRASIVGASAPSPTLKLLAQNDAVATLLGALKERQRKRRARLQAGGTGALPAAPGCVLAPRGGEATPRGDDADAVFQNREMGLTGWII